MRTLVRIILVLAAAVLLVCCVSTQKKSKPNLSKYKSVFIGWIDLNEKDWERFNYEKKEYWTRDAKRVVFNFLRNCEYKIPDKEIRIAKDEHDADFGDASLFVQFSDAFIDYSNSCLFISIRFIDTSTHTELFLLKKGRFDGNSPGFVNSLVAATDEIVLYLSSALSPKTSGG